MTAFNLPPGCTLREIDDAAGDDEDCCGRCGSTIRQGPLYAARGKEPYDWVCEDCLEKAEEEMERGEA